MLKLYMHIFVIVNNLTATICTVVNNYYPIALEIYCKPHCKEAPYLFSASPSLPPPRTPSPCLGWREIGGELGEGGGNGEGGGGSE